MFSRQMVVLMHRVTATRKLSVNAKTCQRFVNEFPDIYKEQYRLSIENPIDYWGEVSKNTVWTQPWSKVVDDTNSPFTKWFVDGKLSMCYNLLDRHIDEGKGSKIACIWDSPVTGKGSKITFQEIKDQVSKLSAVLVKNGIRKGDTVLIYMPMISETLVAMLATIRIGAAHSVVFGGFAANELAQRIKHLEPKCILAASCGVEPTRIVEYKPTLDDALRIANAPDIPIILLQRSEILEAKIDLKKDLDWKEEVQKVNGHDCVDVDSNDPLYILYTSGTTGDPKGIVHPTGPHAVVNKWTMKNLYGMTPDDIWWAASDFGWVVGHEYICYSPLLNGNTTIIYEGKPVGTPDSGQFFRVLADHKVNGFFTTPTAMRSIMTVDPGAEEAKKYDYSSLKYAFVAGEHCDPAIMNWSLEKLGVPVLDNWWQTETAHAITATCVGLGNTLNPPKHSTGKPVPGFNVQIVNEDGSEAPRGKLGRIVCKLPMPPGTMSTLWKASERFKDTYFARQGYYDTMDSGIMDEEGNVMVMARDDDVINVAGHRLSTSAIEEVLLSHPFVQDAAVVGVPDKVKGQRPLGLYILKKGSGTEEEVSRELVKNVRESIGPVAAFKDVVAIPGLPKTRSGKKPRKSIADLASGKELKIPPTIEDPKVYDGIAKKLKARGFKLLE